MTLAGNMYKSELFNRLKWSLDSANGQENLSLSRENSSILSFVETLKGQEETPAFDGQTIHLSPMQIRSFLVKLTKR